MDVSTIHTELKQGKTRKFYIFTGDEWEVQQIYIKQIFTTLQHKYKEYMYARVDNISSKLKKMRHTGVFTGRCLYVARDDKEFISEEELQKQVLNSLGDNYTFILLLTNPDKRTKFYKKYSKDIVEFQPLKENVLKSYLSKKIYLSDKNTNKLVQICENDYGRCLLEIDKILQYMCYVEEHGYDMDCDEAFELLLEDKTFFIPPKDAIFEFVDAILDCKPKLALDLYEQCVAVGEATLVMISVLYTNAKAVLQVQSCDSKDISKTTGLTGWQITNAKKHTNVYSNSDLLYIMELCVKMEQAIKTGQADEKYAMSYILVNGMY